MNEIQIFEHEAFGQIRVIYLDGEPWFVAVDVCSALELEDTGRATSRLDEDELTRIKIVSGGQNREVIAVNPVYTPLYLAAASQRQKPLSGGSPMRCCPPSGRMAIMPLCRWKQASALLPRMTT